MISPSSDDRLIDFAVAYLLAHDPDDALYEMHLEYLVESFCPDVQSFDGHSIYGPLGRILARLQKHQHWWPSRKDEVDQMIRDAFRERRIAALTRELATYGDIQLHQEVDGCIVKVEVKALDKPSQTSELLTPPDSRSEVGVEDQEQVEAAAALTIPLTGFAGQSTLQEGRGGLEQHATSTRGLGHGASQAGHKAASEQAVAGDAECAYSAGTLLQPSSSTSAHKFQVGNAETSHELEVCDSLVHDASADLEATVCQDDIRAGNATTCVDHTSTNQRNENPTSNAENFLSSGEDGFVRRPSVSPDQAAMLVKIMNAPQKRKRGRPLGSKNRKTLRIEKARTKRQSGTEDLSSISTSRVVG